MEKGEIVSIKKIIDQSNPALITEFQNSVWDILREIRNASIHNDGTFTKARAPKEGSYTIGKITMELKFNKEYQLYGDLDLTLKFVELLMELHYLWVKRFYEFN